MNFSLHVFMYLDNDRKLIKIFTNRFFQTRRQQSSRFTIKLRYVLASRIGRASAITGIEDSKCMARMAMHRLCIASYAAQLLWCCNGQRVMTTTSHQMDVNSSDRLHLRYHKKERMINNKEPEYLVLALSTLYGEN